ncbi:transcriptional regulator/antitoxin MazE [Jannaschia seohaensis]|nr:transcriptional regulator/antitoxin MazE [Jannaschia seohaensis]
MRDKIRKVGDSSVVTLTAELLALLDAKDGDMPYVMHADDGKLNIELYHPEVAATLEAAEIVMGQNRTRAERSRELACVVPCPSRLD